MAMATQTDVNPRLSEIRKKFETSEYSIIDDTPCVLEMSHSGVYVPKDNYSPSQGHAIESLILSSRRWNSDKVLTPKLNASGSGLYKLFVTFVPSNLFESRTQLDSLLADEWKFAEPSDNLLSSSVSQETVERMSFEKVVEEFRLEELSCNLEHFSENPNELEKDLGRKLSESETKDVKKIEKELFSKLILNICGFDGEGLDDEGRVSFRNVRRLFYDGNDMYGTAERGNCYYVFHYLV